MPNDWIDAGYWPDAWLVIREERFQTLGSVGKHRAAASELVAADAHWPQRIAAEMTLRGLDPAGGRSSAAIPALPAEADATPADQLRLLAREGDRRGRIPVPCNAQALWAQHKYSILARHPGRYRELGRAVARNGMDFVELATELTTWLREGPDAAGLRNALQHLWGHVAHWQPPERHAANAWSPGRLLAEIRWRAMAGADTYVRHSTALGELGAWLPAGQGAEQEAPRPGESGRGS